MDPVVIGLTLLAIVIVLAITVSLAIRQDRATPRGQEPDKGRFVREIPYQSGLGGGQVARIDVPRDPQAYARQFVPKSARKEDP